MDYPNFRLDGQVAVVTGASKGIGYDLSKAVAHAGAKVAVVARDIDTLNQLADEIRADGGEALALQLDVTNVPLQVGDAGNGSIASPTTVNGGSLAGTGTVTGPVDVNVGGAISPGDNSGAGIGSLNIQGTTTLGGGASLDSHYGLHKSQAEVNAAKAAGQSVSITLDPNTLYQGVQDWPLDAIYTAYASDQLDVDGLLDLSGDGDILDLSSMSADWVPNMEFDVLDFDSIDGEFDAIIVPNIYSDDWAILTGDELLPELDGNGEGLGGILAWDFTDLYTTGVIRVVPEPSTWLLSLAGLLALGLYRRRRSVK